VEHDKAFLTLVQALRPWMGQLVFVGGWAHRLHRLHPLAAAPGHRPVVTRDADLALPLDADVQGDIGEALRQAGFTERFIGTDTPPVTHYELGDEDGGFYAEFLAPLKGDGRKRDGQPDVAVTKSGITIQKVRHLDLLLVQPWTVGLPTAAGADATQLRVPNAVSFIVQKLLIHDKRKDPKKAQDVVYVHDTLELFGGSLEELGVLWHDHIRPALPAKQAAAVVRIAGAIFGEVSDVMREAARIPQDRILSPESIRGACEYGLQEILGEAG